MQSVFITTAINSMPIIFTKQYSIENAVLYGKTHDICQWSASVALWENTYIGGRQQEPLSMFNPEYKFRTRSRCLTAVSLYRDEDQLCVCLNGFLLSVY